MEQRPRIKVSQKFDDYIGSLSSRFSTKKVYISQMIPDVMPKIEDIQIIKQHNKTKTLRVVYETRL